MPIRTVPEPLQNTGIWNIITPAPPAPEPAPPMPQPQYSQPATDAVAGASVQSMQPQAAPQTPAETMTAEEQYMAQSQPDYQTPRPYQSQNSAAPAGMLRNQVESQRGGADSGAYGKLAVGVGASLLGGGAAIEAGAAALGAGPGSSLVGALNGPIGTAARLGAQGFLGSGLGRGISEVPGYGDLPRPAQTALQVAPYVVGGSGSLLKKGLEIGAAVGGSEAAQFANKHLGLGAPDWVADTIGQGVGAVSLGQIEKRAPAQIAHILGENHSSGDKAVDELLGWGKKEDAFGGADKTIDRRPGALRSADDVMNEQRQKVGNLPTGEIRARFNDASSGSKTTMNAEERQTAIGDIMLRNKQIESEMAKFADENGGIADEDWPAYNQLEIEYRGNKTKINDMVNQPPSDTANNAHNMQDTVMYGEELYRRTDGAEGIKPAPEGMREVSNSDLRAGRQKPIAQMTDEEIVSALRDNQRALSAHERKIDEAYHYDAFDPSIADHESGQDMLDQDGERMINELISRGNLKAASEFAWTPGMEGMKFEGGDTTPAGSDYQAGFGRQKTLAAQVQSQQVVTPMADAPSVENLMAGVDTIANEGAVNHAARALAGEVNPSVKRETAIGRLGTAINRGKIAIEGLVQERMKSWYDPSARTGLLNRDVWQLDKDNFTQVKEVSTGSKVKVPINKVLEHPNDYILGAEQSDYKRVVNEMIQHTEDYRIRNGLSPRQISRFPLGPGEEEYFPRNITHKGDLELPTDSSANLSRSGRTVDELIADGHKFADPRTAMENYVRDAYEEVFIQQQTEMLHRFGVAPSEMVPEDTRIAKEQADDALNKQRSYQKKEASMTQNLARGALIKDLNSADVDLRRAKSNLRALQAAVAAETNSSKVKQQALSWGTRLANAKAIVNTAQAARDAAYANFKPKKTGGVNWTPAMQKNVGDVRNAASALNAARDASRAGGMFQNVAKDPAVKAAQKVYDTAQKEFGKNVAANSANVTRGKPGINLVSDGTLRETARLEREFNKANNDYVSALEHVKTDAPAGMATSPGYWDDSVVSARQNMNDMEKAYHATQEAKGLLRGTNPAIMLRREKQALNWSDPDIKAARQTWRQSQKAYDSALSNAKDLHEANGDSDIIANTRGKGIGTGLFFPKRDLQQFEKGLDLAAPRDESTSNTAKTIGSVGQGILNTARSVATGADFGIGFVHLLPVAFRDPNAWVKAVAHNYIDAVNPNNFSTFAQKHNDSIQWLAQHGVTMSGNDLYAATRPGEGLSPSNLLGKIPNEKGVGAARTLAQAGKQTYGRLSHATEAAQTVAQTLLYEGMAKHWTGTEEDLAHSIRNMTGALDSRALGVSRLGRNIEATFMALSPRLLRSSLAMMGDLRYLSPTSDPTKRALGVEALRSLGSLTAGAAMVYGLSGLILGKSKKEMEQGINPMNGKQFMSHKINGQWIGFGGVMRGLIQMTAMAASAAAPGGRPIEDLWALNGQSNPVLKFMLSRGAPFMNVAGQIGEAATGANLDSYNQIDSLGDLSAALGKDILPYTIAGHLEGDSLLGSGANTAGLRTSPETPAEDRVDYIEHNVIPELKGKGVLPLDVNHLEDLGFGEQDAVKRELAARSPDLVSAYEEYRRQHGSIYQAKEDGRQKIDQSYNGAYDEILKGLNDGSMDPQEAKSALTNVRNREQGELENFYNNDPEYQNALKHIKPNDMQTLAQAWFKIPESIHGTSKTPLTADEWDAVDAKQKTFMTNLQQSNPAMATRFQNDLAQRNSVVDAHPLIQAKREIDQASQTYYDLPEGQQRDDYLAKSPALNVQRWYMYGTSLKSTEAVDMALNRQAPGKTGQFIASPSFNRDVKLDGFSHAINTDLATWQQDRGTITKFLSLPPLQRTLALSAVPQFQALSVYWGHSDKLDEDSLPLFVQRMNAHPTPQWNQNVLVNGKQIQQSQIIPLYYAMPETNKDKVDKQHLRSKSPELDAVIAMYEEKQWGKVPSFRSQAGASMFYKLTGRSVEKFAVNPPKD